jgi:hypothetical protein
MSAHSEDIGDPETEFLEHHCSLDYFAALCTVCALLISGHQILMHLIKFYEPQIQLQVIRILAIIPVRRLKLIL